MQRDINNQMKGAGRGKEEVRVPTPLSPRSKGFSWVLKPGGYFKSKSPCGKQAPSFTLLIPLIFSTEQMVVMDAWGETYQKMEL